MGNASKDPWAWPFAAHSRCRQLEYSSLLAETSFDSGTGGLQKLDESLLSLLPLLNLVLQHLFDTVVDLVDHLGQRVLRLLPLLPLLIQLLVKLGHFFRKDVDQDHAAFLTLSVFVVDGMGNLDDRVAEGLLVPVAALFPGFLLFR